MEVQCLSLDRISTLPQDIIDRVLILLPTRDALRMSILSRKWRYCWACIPVFVFDKNFFEGSSYTKQVTKQEIANSIFRVLQLHTGPVLMEFTLFIELQMACDIDQIILSLSMKDSLKYFNLMNLSENSYKLPTSFFSFQGLEHLKLSRCVIKPPSKVNVFSTLRWLYFSNIKISTHNLKRVLTNCPLLKEFYLVGDSKYITGGQKITFVELFECLPSLVLLAISKVYLQYFVVDGRLPRAHIRFLSLGGYFKGQEKLFSFYVIKNSLNLENINLRLLVGPRSISFRVLEDLVGFDLDHLEELEMVISRCRDSIVELMFVLKVMAKSPLLTKVRIQLDDNISDYVEHSFRGLLRIPYPRASLSINFIIERSETFS